MGRGGPYSSIPLVLPLPMSAPPIPAHRDACHADTHPGTTSTINVGAKFPSPVWKDETVQKTFHFLRWLTPSRTTLHKNIPPPGRSPFSHACSPIYYDNHRKHFPFLAPTPLTAPPLMTPFLRQGRLLLEHRQELLVGLVPQADGPRGLLQAHPVEALVHQGVAPGQDAVIASQQPGSGDDVADIVLLQLGHPILRQEGLQVGQALCRDGHQVGAGAPGAQGHQGNALRLGLRDQGGNGVQSVQADLRQVGLVGGVQRADSAELGVLAAQALHGVAPGLLGGVAALVGVNREAEPALRQLVADLHVPHHALHDGLEVLAAQGLGVAGGDLDLGLVQGQPHRVQVPQQVRPHVVRQAGRAGGHRLAVLVLLPGLHEEDTLLQLRQAVLAEHGVAQRGVWRRGERPRQPHVAV
eukprot:RCo018521